MSRTVIVVALASVAMMMGITMSQAQAVTYTSVTPMIVGAKDGPGPSHTAGLRDAAGPAHSAGAKDGPGPRGEFKGGPDARPGGPAPLHALIMATREPWARDNADVQKLVDKVIADRRAVLASENARLDSLEKAVLANRGGDQAAIKAAMEAFRTANEKVMADEKQMRDDLRALEEKIRELNPNPQIAPGRGGDRPQEKPEQPK